MKWEYKIIKVGSFSKFNETEKLQQELNNYGTEGWELVCFNYPPQVGEGTISKLDTDSVIFKRRASNI